MAFEWIDVANVEVDSNRGQAVITLQRNWPRSEARLTDLPEDFKVALLKWLTASERGDDGTQPDQ
jgi:hypothetical protein